MLHSLYVRGRHNMISTITATQRFNAIHPITRVNAIELYVYRLRNMQDLETFIDEVSAVLDKKTLLELYHIATAEPYSFLYVKLTAKNREEMFNQNFPSDSWYSKNIDCVYTQYVANRNNQALHIICINRSICCFCASICICCWFTTWCSSWIADTE